MPWLYEGGTSFGLAPVKREGHKIDPMHYVSLYGDFPDRSLYTDDEYAVLQLDGWKWLED